MNISKHIGGAFLVGAASLFLLSPSLLLAGPVTWNKGADTGNYTTNLMSTVNWTGGFPGNGSNVFMVWNRGNSGGANTITVTNAPSDKFFADSLTITNASLQKSTVILNLSGQTFLTNGAGALLFAGAVNSGGTANNITLKFLSNLTFNAATFVGQAGDGNATMTFAGGTVVGSNLTFTGAASGSGKKSLIVGTTLNLYNDMAVSGNSNSTVIISNSTATVAGRLSVAGNTTDQYFTLTNATLTVSNGLLNTGKIDVFNRGVLNSANAWTNNGVLNVLAGGRITGGTLTNQSNGTITDAGVIDALLINQGRVNFGGTVSNSLVNSGIVQLNNTATITQTANADGGTYNLAGNNLIVGQLAMTAGVISNTGNARLVLNGNATGNASASTAIITGGILDLTGGTRAFAIADGAATIDMLVSAVVSNGGLVKAGPGTLELTGANKYTGGTTVSNGTLRVNNATGSGTGTGTVTIESGGTLGGTGTVSGLLTVKAGGTLAPGNSVGTLQLGSLDLNPSSTLEIEIASPTSYDKLSLTGSATLGGDLNLVFLGGYTPDPGDSFTILSADSGVSGVFDSVTAGYTYSLVGNDVIVTVVPEPSALTLAAAGILMAFLAIRRRR